MKRLFLMMAVAMLSMNAVMAENENENATSTIVAYDMASVNYNKLASALCLNYDQAEAVADIHNNFAAEMINAGAASTSDERKVLMDKAIKKNLAYMHYVLSHEQYRKYLLLLNNTLNNRGLNK